MVGGAARSHAQLNNGFNLDGFKVPEGDKFWQVLSDLKDVVELAVFHTFTDETNQYIACEISDLKQLLQEVFPSLQLRLKHH